MHKRTAGFFPWRHWALIMFAAIFTCVLFLGISLVSVSGEVMAQDGNAPASSNSAAGADEVTADEVTADEVNEVARQIWCPLCNGVRLDSCELRACDQMKEVISIKLSEGEDANSIIAYFVEQYGPQVLGEPPREGFNWLAWILPVVAVVVGGYFFWRTTQRMVRPRDDDDLAEIALSQVPNRQVITVTVPKEAEAMSEEEVYAQKLDEELAKYG